MNDLVRFARSVEYATGKKRGRHPVFNSNMFYPYKEELQLQQATKKQFERFIAEAYEAAISGEAFAFTDDLNALSNLPEELPDSFKSEVSAIGRAIGQKVSNVIANSSEMIVGKPYYPPAAKDEIFKTWEANFDMLCKSAESDIKKDISRIVLQAKNEGWNGKQVEKAVRSELPEKYKNRAEVIARTEAAKLNTQATMSTYKEIGCQYYMWMATLDERVRPDHAAMNGRICSVSDPTVYFDENPDDPLHPVEKPRVDGEMCMLHPGEDFQCRCTMVMWDPEIDGKYEVKEKPAEEKTEEHEQRTENDPASRELEKANERLARQEKELERAKNEAKTAEKELANEKSARQAAEKAKTEAEVARKEAERKATEEERRKRILQAANERHLRRTRPEVEGIQYRWDLRKDERSYDVAHREFFRHVEKELGVKRGISKSHVDANSRMENPKYSLGTPEYRNNCQTCVPVYLLRRWGFDVEALSFSTYKRLNLFWTRRYLNKDGTAIDLSGAWSTAYDKNIKNSGLMTFFKRSTKESGIYEVYCAWKDGGAHVFCAIKENGVLVLHDPQSGLAVRPEEYFPGMRPTKVYVERIDDKIIDLKMLGAFKVK